MAYNILTIEREFGTGGYEIAMELSKLLQIPFYDQNKIRLILNHEGNFTRAQQPSSTEKTNPMLYNLTAKMSDKEGCITPVDDETAKKEFGVIRRLSEEGPCIILGRCANYILRNRSDVYSVFIQGDVERKKQRMQRMLGNVSADLVLQEMKHTDQSRSEYYHHFTGKRWDDPSDYNIILDEANMTEEEMVLFLMNHMQKQAMDYTEQRKHYINQ
ncbi:MAG: cytidylate kinase-like family protein [Anaerostipes sp.]|nr:cytidylate kinase-like family protein [Anaerostipes sp.]